MGIRKMKKVLGFIILIGVLFGIFYITYIFSPYSLKETIGIWVASLAVSFLIYLGIYLIVKD
jgi:hypothetical protein